MSDAFNVSCLSPATIRECVDTLRYLAAEYGRGPIGAVEMRHVLDALAKVNAEQSGRAYRADMRGVMSQAAE